MLTRVTTGESMKTIEQAARTTGRRAGKQRARIALPPAYLHLVKRFRLRPLQSDEELDEAIEVIDQLLSRKKLLPEEEEYLDILSDIVERYEDEHVLIPDVSAADMLRHLIEAKGVTQQSVAAATGISNSTISALLSGKREMTRKHLEKLGSYFCVDPAVFLPGN